MSSFNPKRLELARRRRGLTKVELAEATSISVRTLTAYESGRSEPGQLNLGRLAETLHFPVAFFSGPDLDEPPIDGSSFRALSTLSARQRDQTLGAGAIALTLSDWINARFALPEPTVPRYQGVDPETAAMAVRSEWGLGERPIKNVIHLLEAHGVRVFSLVEDCAAMDAFSFWRGDIPYVCLNTRKTTERSRMDAAHELGHLVLHRGGERSRKNELEADLFGSVFLMPTGGMLATAPRGGSLGAILLAKRRWGVSAANYVHRMYGLKLLTEWQYRSLFIELGRHGYRKGEPDGMPAETSQVFTKVFKALLEEGVTRRQVAEELTIYPDELNRAIFGLTLMPLEGYTDPAPAKQDEPKQQTQLRLI